MVKVFLDVGAHDGQTLKEVLKAEYRFDRVYAFEPMPVQYANLVANYGRAPNVELLNVGLAGASGDRVLYGANLDMEASLYAAKNDVDESVMTTCHFLDASEFLAGRFDGDVVVMKLNCEGGEIEILDSLLDSGEIDKLAHVMIDFDIRKVVGMEEHEDRIVARLADYGFTRWSFSYSVMKGSTHQARIGHWLKGLGI